MNKVILIGRLTKDPEIRYTQNNAPVCSFTLAVDRRFSKDKQADFINCQAWQKTAEFITKYFGKGNLLAIVGRIQTRTWEDEDGKRHYVTEVVAEEAYFTGDRNNSRPEPQDDRFEPLDDEDDDLPF